MTGGWTLVTSGGYFGGSATKGTDSISLTPIHTSYKNRTGAYMNNSIPKGNYTKLCMEFVVDTSYTSSEGVTLSQNSNNTISNNLIGTSVASAETGGANKTRLDVSLSNATNIYVSFKTHDQNAEIKRVWLE